MTAPHGVPVAEAAHWLSAMREVSEGRRNSGLEARRIAFEPDAPSKQLGTSGCGLGLPH